MQHLTHDKRYTSVRGSPRSVGYAHQTVTSCDIYFIKEFQLATTRFAVIHICYITRYSLFTEYFLSCWSIYNPIFYSHEHLWFCSNGPLLKQAKSHHYSIWLTQSTNVETIQYMQGNKSSRLKNKTHQHTWIHISFQIPILAHVCVLHMTRTGCSC